MDTAMHDMGSLGRMLQIDLPRDWANLALYRDVWRGWSAGAEFRAVFYLFILVFLCVRCWGPRFEFCVFVAGWRHVGGLNQ